MTIAEKRERNAKIIQFLSTPKEDGTYPPLFEAALLFGLSPGQIFRIKKDALGLGQEYQNGQ